MEFKGNEFIRNIEIEKEKAELKKQSDALELEKKQSVINNNYNAASSNSPQYFENNSAPVNFNEDPVLVDIKNDSGGQELDDILLSNNAKEVNQENKKKYIVLSIALIILFILTIIIIQLISEDKQEDKLFVKTDIEKIKQDKIIGTNNEDKKYQELIDKKTKKKINKKLNLDAIVKEETPIQIPKEKPTQTVIKKTTTDVFGMETKAKEITKKPIKKEITIPVKQVITPKKKVIKKIIEQPKVTPVVKKTPSKVSGLYIQIGAFTKPPSKTLVNKIKKAGYNYIVHKMVIKGTLYNKVLIGPYANKIEAKKVIGKIKKDLKSSGAYILKLK